MVDNDLELSTHLRTLLRVIDNRRHRPGLIADHDTQPKVQKTAEIAALSKLWQAVAGRKPTAEELRHVLGGER